MPSTKLAGDVFRASYVGDATFGDKINISNSADTERREVVQKTKPHIVFL